MTSYFCPHRNREIDLDKTFHGPIRKRTVSWPTPRNTYNKRYYEGGYRMVIDGIPIRLAAHVKNWKPSSRAALGKGFDPTGLILTERDLNKRQRRSWHWLGSDTDRIRFAGDLFNHSPEWREQVACEVIAKALRPHPYSKFQYFTPPEEKAAAMIGEALSEWGFANHWHECYADADPLPWHLNTANVALSNNQPNERNKPCQTLPMTA